MAFSMIPWSPPSYGSCADTGCRRPHTLRGALWGAGWGRYLWLTISQQACDLLQQHKLEVNVDVSSVELRTKHLCFKRTNLLQNSSTTWRKHHCFVLGSRGEGQENDLVIRSVPSLLQELMSLLVTVVGLVTLSLVSVCTLSGIALLLCYPCWIA